MNEPRQLGGRQQEQIMSKAARSVERAGNAEGGEPRMKHGPTRMKKRD
jgi:hypothetical protein